jgi:hypothetical protein
MKFTLSDLDDLYEAQELLYMAEKWVGRSLASQEEAEIVGYLRRKIRAYIERVEGGHAPQC